MGGVEIVAHIGSERASLHGKVTDRLNRRPREIAGARHAALAGAPSAHGE